MITEENLINLGFEKVDGFLEGQTEPWYYYTMEIGDMYLTSSESDVTKEREWKIYLYEFPDFVIDNMSNLNGFINIVRRIYKNKN